MDRKTIKGKVRIIATAACFEDDERALNFLDCKSIEVGERGINPQNKDLKDDMIV